MYLPLFSAVILVIVTLSLHGGTARFDVIIIIYTIIITYFFAFEKTFFRKISQFFKTAEQIYFSTSEAQVVPYSVG
jgi:hypothetical protein